MHPAVQELIAECPGLGEPYHDLEVKAVTNSEVREVLRIFAWIAQQPDRSTDERLKAMDKLLAFVQSRPGTHVWIPSVRGFLGWGPVQ
jgi:hypothetical protein